MSKGLADQIVVSARLLDREIERKQKGVEMPLFKEEYYEWLKTQEKLSEGSIVNYKRWLENADELIDIEGKDFYTLFQKSFELFDYDNCKELIKWYDDLLTEEIKQAEKEIICETPKTLKNWRSAFRKHAEFLSLCMTEAIDEAKKMNESIQKSRESASTLFLENRFFGWLISPDNPDQRSAATAESYVSQIKTVNKKLFCKTGYDILAMLPDFIKTNNVEKMNEMFEALDDKLTERINEKNETVMSLRQLENSRSALRKYTEFIKSLTITE